MREDTKRQIDDDYKILKNHLHEDKELREMCKRCEEWCGEEHDYDECLKKPCFIFYRCYRFLDNLNSWRNDREYFVR